MRYLLLALITEGTTDVRFLEILIRRLIDVILEQCGGTTLVEQSLDDICKKVDGATFVEKMVNAVDYADKEGFEVLFIHADSDDKSAKEVVQNKFVPLFMQFMQLGDMSLRKKCKTVVPTIPIQMIESWMMADKQLLVHLINGDGIRLEKLGLEKAPENYSDPKQAIMDAIVASKQIKGKDYDLDISSLYSSIAQQVSFEKLRTIPSYCYFENSMKKFMMEGHYIEWDKGLLQQIDHELQNL